MTDKPLTRSEVQQLLAKERETTLRAVGLAIAKLRKEFEDANVVFPDAVGEAIGRSIADFEKDLLRRFDLKRRTTIDAEAEQVDLDVRRPRWIGGGRG